MLGPLSDYAEPFPHSPSVVQSGPGPSIKECHHPIPTSMIIIHPHLYLFANRHLTTAGLTLALAILLARKPCLATDILYLHTPSTHARTPHRRANMWMTTDTTIPRVLQDCDPSLVLSTYRLRQGHIYGIVLYAYDSRLRGSFSSPPFIIYRLPVGRFLSDFFASST